MVQAVNSKLCITLVLPSLSLSVIAGDVSEQIVDQYSDKIKSVNTLVHDGDMQYFVQGNKQSSTLMLSLRETAYADHWEIAIQGGVLERLPKIFDFDFPAVPDYQLVQKLMNIIFVISYLK